MKSLTWGSLAVVGATAFAIAMYSAEISEAETVAAAPAKELAPAAETGAAGTQLWLKPCADAECAAAFSPFSRRYESVPVANQEGFPLACKLREVTDYVLSPFLVVVDEPVKGGWALTRLPDSPASSECSSPSDDCSDLVIACNMGC